jgi:hypothetical protein
MQSRPGYRNQQIHLKAYSPDRRLCAFTVLKEYLYRTNIYVKTVLSYLSAMLSHTKMSVEIQLQDG